MQFNPGRAKEAQEIVFSQNKKQVIQVYTLMMHKYNDHLFKNILLFFRWKALVFGTYWCKNKQNNSKG